MTALRRVLFVSVFTVALLVPAGCDTVPFVNDGSGPAPGDISFEGEVVYRNVEGGCWGIEADDGTTYEPKSLPSDFRRNGLRVRVRATDSDHVSICQIGRNVTITSIRRQ